MSSTIWTRCAGSSEIRLLRSRPWRAVEAQHQVATRKLVDSSEEQALLEDLLERRKPPLRSDPSLHYLLAAPFRYPPLRHGSRFGGRFEPGIWYGAESIRTVFAEVAYYRLLFLEGSRADLSPLTADLTLFRVRVRTTRGIDLTRPPFDRHRSAIASPSSYRASQSLGSAMRAAGVRAFRYASARDRRNGRCLGVFVPDAFTASRPEELSTWSSVATPEHVDLSKRDYFGRRTFRFRREEFLEDGRLPHPAT